MCSRPGPPSFCDGRARLGSPSPKMCRWIFYYGEEVCIAKLIFGATHGLATMSEVGRATPAPACRRVVCSSRSVSLVFFLVLVPSQCLPVARETLRLPAAPGATQPTPRLEGRHFATLPDAPRRSPTLFLQGAFNDTTFCFAAARNLIDYQDHQVGAPCSLSATLREGRRIHPWVRAQQAAQPSCERPRLWDRLVRVRADRACRRGRPGRLRPADSVHDGEMR